MRCCRSIRVSFSIVKIHVNTKQKRERVYTSPEDVYSLTFGRLTYIYFFMPGRLYKLFNGSCFK